MSWQVDVLGVGLAARGLASWADFCRVLEGGELDAEQSLPLTSLLHPRERRRSPATVRISLAAAEQACAMAGLAVDQPQAIFCSAMGDLEINDYMCRTLAESPEHLSPTRFHNSVHNAAAGYWSIGAGMLGDVTALSGYVDSVTAGMIEAVARVHADQQPVLLVVYDDRAEGPMRALWPVTEAFGGALLLAPPGSPSPLAQLELGLSTAPASGPLLPPSLQARMADNPAARLLPLLALIAGRSGEVYLVSEQGPGLRVARRAS